MKWNSRPAARPSHEGERWPSPEPEANASSPPPFRHSPQDHAPDTHAGVRDINLRSHAVSVQDLDAAHRFWRAWQRQR